MVGLKTNVSHYLLVLSIVLAARDVDAEETAVPSVAIHFAFDRQLDAIMAPFFRAAQNDKFGAERLNVFLRPHGWIAGSICARCRLQ